MKFLIVDDELNNRILLRKMLAPYGVCDMAVDGLEAVEAFEFALNEGELYDLVLMDIMMPDMDGQRALVKIRELERARGIPDTAASRIFMITALTSQNQVVQAFFHGGCTDYITKPFTRETLFAKMQEYGLKLGENQ